MKALRDEREEVTLVDPRESKNTKPLEEVALVSIHPDYLDRHVMIWTELTEELRSALVEFLKKTMTSLHGLRAICQELILRSPCTSCLPTLTIP